MAGRDRPPEEAAQGADRAVPVRGRAHARGDGGYACADGLPAVLYGTGMRPLEGPRLWVKDVDLARREIVVRDGKGGKDRVVTGT